MLAPRRSMALAGTMLALAFLAAPRCSDGGKSGGEDSRAGVSETEILVGSSSALSGHASFLGTEYTRGSLAYLQKVNDGGGVHGRRIRLVCEDDQYDPALCVANTQKLIQDGVFLLFDYVGTPTSVKIVDLVEEARIPALGFFTGAEPLRTPFRPYLFHVRDSYYAEAESAVAHFADRLGLERIAVMYQEDAFGLAVLTGVQLALGRRGMSTCATDTYLRGTMAVEKAMETIRTSDAQAVIMVGTYSPLARFIGLAHEAGYTPWFHTVSFVGSEAFGRELVQVYHVDPAQYERILVTQVVPSPFAEDLPVVVEYRETRARYFPDEAPSYVALEGFLNAKVLVRALEDSGRDLTRRRFVDALEAMHDLDVGAGLDVTYGPGDHQGFSGTFYSRLTGDGSFRLAKP